MQPTTLGNKHATACFYIRTSKHIRTLKVPHATSYFSDSFNLKFGFQSVQVCNALDQHARQLRRFQYIYWHSMHLRVCINSMCVCICVCAHRFFCCHGRSLGSFLGILLPKVDLVITPGAKTGVNLLGPVVYMSILPRLPKEILETAPRDGPRRVAFLPCLWRGRRSQRPCVLGQGGQLGAGLPPVLLPPRVGRADEDPSVHRQHQAVGGGRSSYILERGP